MDELTRAREPVPWKPLPEIEDGGNGVSELRIRPEPVFELGPTQVYPGDVLRDFLRDQPPPEPLLAGLAYRGMSTLFYGREKVGKSEVCSMVVAEVSQRGKVLVFGLEEAESYAVRRLSERYGARMGSVLYGPSLDSMMSLEMAVEALKPDLVIVDSLTAMVQVGFREDVSENSAEMGRYVQQLSDVAHTRSCGMVVVHHATKQGHSFRGSTAIAAGVDILVGMEAHQGELEDPRRYFSLHGRGVVPDDKMRAVWNGKRMVRSRELEGIEAEVVGTIEMNPGCSGAALRKALGHRAEDILQAARILVERGDIERRQRNGKGGGWAYWPAGPRGGA